MPDTFLLIGGLIFIGLGIVSYTNRDLLWSLYSKEPRWRRDNPERTPEWDERARKFGMVYLVVGVIFVILSFLLA